MKTMLIRVGEPAGGNGCYPVQLLLAESTGEQHALAAGSIPAELPQIGDVSLTEHARMSVLQRRNLSTLGEQLYQLLATSGIGPEWERVRQETPGELRTIYDLKPQTLRKLPWELLRHDDRWLFVDSSRQRPSTRAVRYDPAHQHDCELVPVRVLVVVAEPAAPKIAADDEVSGIIQALDPRQAHYGKVHIEILYGPTRAKFLSTYQELQPHVLHVIGHGRLAPGTKEPIIPFRPDGPGGWEFTAEDVRNRFASAPLRLVVLNACRTADPVEHEGSWSIADEFVKHGVPAVLSMQGDILSVAAVTFTAAMYRALWNGVPLDSAVSAARLAVDDEHGDVHWCLPSLTLQVPPDKVLRFRCGVPDEEVQALDQINEFGALQAFVNRSTQRRKAWFGVDPESFVTAPSRNVLIVSGDSDIGKTWMVQGCLMTCYLRGRDVRYVDLKATGHKDWLNVLWTIRHGSGGPAGSKLQRPLDDEACASFDHDLPFLIHDQPPREGCDPPARKFDPDGRLQWGDRSEHAADYNRQIFDRLLTGLRNMARVRPLIVALDHLSEDNLSDFEHYLLPYLVRPIALADNSALRLILVLTADQLKRVPHNILQRAEKVPLETFAKEEFIRHAREYVTRKNQPYTPDLAEIFSSIEAKLPDTGWKPLEGLRSVEALQVLFGGGR